MSWSEIENAYLDRLAANAFPGTPPEDQEPVKAASTAQPTAAPAEMRAIPKNETLGAVADFVGRVREMANQYEIKDWVPLLGGLGVGDLLVGKSPEEIENWAYGNLPATMPPPGTGGYVPVMKTGRKQSVADTAMLGLDVAGPAVGVGKLAKTMATEIATTPPVGAIKIGAAAPVEQVAEIAVKIGEREIKVPADQASILSKAIKNLTPAEQLKFKSDTARTFVERLTALPSKQEFGAAAIGGRAKKGWYEGSTQAIVNVFGPDANRFAALLSATSPQTSVESNLYNALQIWKNWTAAGRPTERDAIIKVMGESVQGGKGKESVLDAWKNNSVAALTAEDPGKLILSGPKVNSFMLNLQGNVEEVTNDAWMASFSLVDQKIFGGSLTKTDPGKGPGYLAMNARVRETATYLTKLTGETWTPAEVQETIWSWAKTLYETAGAAGETRSAVQLVRDNAITDELISSTPDFRTLFYDERFAPILEQAGYGEQLARLRAASSTSDVSTGSQKPGTGSQAAAIDPEAQRKLLERNAKRLDTLRKQRELAAAEKAALEKGAK
jgi:hypothetical protein